MIIPNSKLSNEVIINISKLGKRGLDIEMKFSYAYYIAAVQSIVSKTLAHSKLVEEGPKPTTGVSLLDADGFKVMIHAWVDAFEFEESKFEVQKLLVDDLKAAGIKLPGMV